MLLDSCYTHGLAWCEGLVERLCCRDVAEPMHVAHASSQACLLEHLMYRFLRGHA